MCNKIVSGNWKTIFIMFLYLLLLPARLHAKVPDTVVIDTSIWNGAVTGEVLSCNKFDNYLEAKVRISNPKYFWTKIVIQNFFNNYVDPDSLYSNFGFLGPVSSTIPWEPGFSGADYIIRFKDNNQTVNIGVDPTLNNGTEAAFLNLAQIILTAAPAQASALSLKNLSDIIDYIKDSPELLDIADQIFNQGDLIGGVRSIVELALFQPEVLLGIYTKVGLSITIDEVKEALVLWDILDIVRQVSDQACTFIFGEPSGYVIFKAISTESGQDDDPYITASFSANPQSASSDLEVQFNASGCVAHNDQITSYQWSFGDGSSATTESSYINHQYSAKGFYKAHLTIKSSRGLSDESEMSISVGDAHLGGTILSGGTLSTSTTWTVAESPYLLKGRLSIPKGISLTIEQGVEVIIVPGIDFAVYGTLKATGVTFTGTDDQNKWLGILFTGSEASKSVLESCTFEYARGWIYDNCYLRGVLTCMESSPTIKNCNINGSDYCGIYISSGSFPSVNGNKIENHPTGIYIDGSSGGIYQGNAIAYNDYGIQVSYSNNNPELNGNSYSENKNGDFYVGGTIEGNVQWAESGDTVYNTSWLTIAKGASLTIGAGRTIKLNSSAVITVYGTLKATGVTFTGTDDQNKWLGILFTGSEASKSVLESCTFEYARGWIYDNCYLRGVLTCMESSPTIKNCNINGSDYCGIYISSGSFPSVNGNKIENHPTGIYIDGSSGGIYQGNLISNNSSYGFYYSGSNIINAIDNYWGDLSGPLDDSDDKATGGLYNPDGKGDRVSDYVNYYPWKEIYSQTILLNEVNALLDTIENQFPSVFSHEDVIDSINDWDDKLVYRQYTNGCGLGVYHGYLWYKLPQQSSSQYDWLVFSTIDEAITYFCNGECPSTYLVFPFQDRSDIWQICQGYNTNISHEGALINSLDFAYGTGNLGGTKGCSGNPTASEDRVVVSPGMGEIKWNGSTDTDITCIKLEEPVSNGHGKDIKSIELGHLKSDGNRVAAGEVVAKGDAVGELCGVGDNCPTYNDYSHVHMSVYTSDDCSGTSAAIGNIFGNGYDFSSDGTAHQWRGTEISAE